MTRRRASKNAFRAALGMMAMLFAFAFDYRAYRRHAKKAILVMIGLLVATLLFGDKIRGMRGFLLMFQPSEVAKIVLEATFGRDPRDQILAGFVAWCVHARLRVGDALRTPAEPSLDLAAPDNPEGIHLIETSLLKHKTAARGSRRRRASAQA